MSTIEHLTPQTLHASPIHGSLLGFLLDREAQRCSPKTLEMYRYTLGSFVAWATEQGIRDVREVTSSHCRAYILYVRQRGVKDTTEHAHARNLKTFFRWLSDEDEIDASPMVKVKLPKLEERVPPPFSKDEVERLLKVCDRRRPRGQRNYALLLTLLDTGLRAAELCSLNVGAVDFRNGLCQVMGKGAKQRQVRIGSRARAAILRYLAYRAGLEDTDPLWITYLRGNVPQHGLGVHGLQTVCTRLGQLAGVTPCGPHRFRRTFALWCLRDGMDLHSLRVLMGHSSLAVLQRYLKLAGEDIERAHIQHSPVDKLLV